MYNGSRAHYRDRARPRLPDPRPARPHHRRARRHRHGALGPARQIAGPAGLAAARRPAPDAHAGLRLGRLGAGRTASSPSCSASSIAAISRRSRCGSAPATARSITRSGGSVRRARGSTRDRHHVRRARHLDGRRGQALLPRGRGMRHRLAGGAGHRRRQARSGGGPGVDRHPDRERRVRVHALRFPRPDRAARRRHPAARPVDRRRHHRGDAHRGLGERQPATLRAAPMGWCA